MSKEEQAEERPMRLIREKKMEEYGIHVETGKQLEERLKQIDQLTTEAHKQLTGNTALAKMDSLRIKIRDFDKLLRKSCVAWLRAGSEERFRRAVHGYERLLSYIQRDWLAITNEMRDRTEVEQSKMEIEFEIWPARYYFSKALFLADMSFAERDVGPSKDRTIVVQTIAGQKPFDMGALDTIGKDRGNKSEE